MKVKALHFGKAMSVALFVLLLVVVGSKNALAQSLIATLQHGDTISTYYGANAFVQAHDAAQTGDIITLSNGTFTATTITKAITLRGAGCYLDTVTGIQPTVFSSVVDANVPDEEHSLTIEGVNFSNFRFILLNNPRFIKCHFFAFTTYYGSMQNAQFVNCRVSIPYGEFFYNNTFYATNTQFINCHVKTEPSNLKTVSIINSIVEFTNDGQVEMLASNSIFYSRANAWYSYYSIDASGSIIHNCVAMHLSGMMDYQDTTNLVEHDFGDVFETYDGYELDFSNQIYESFDLTSDFTSTFTGSDGTEVGIHGGLAPYTSRPNYMVLKQCNVASQSTIDNKLSVEIQVFSEGE